MNTNVCSAALVCNWACSWEFLQNCNNYHYQLLVCHRLKRHTAAYMLALMISCIHTKTHSKYLLEIMHHYRKCKKTREYNKIIPFTLHATMITARIFSHSHLHGAHAMHTQEHVKQYQRDWWSINHLLPPKKVSMQTEAREEHILCRGCLYKTLFASDSMQNLTVAWKEAG